MTQLHERPVPEPDLLPKILFIVGAPRSGSTVFEQLLASTGDAFAIGEARHIWKRGFRANQLCSCGVPFHDCVFWSRAAALIARGRDLKELAERAIQIMQLVDRDRAIPAMHHPRLRSRAFVRPYDETRDLLSALYRTVAELNPGRLIIDSSKDPSYAHLVSTLEDVEIAFVHLVRDSRGVAESWRHPKANPAVHWRTASLETWDIRHSAFDWNRKYLLTSALKPYLRGRVLTVTYENMTRDPTRVIEAVRDHLLRLGMPRLGEPWEANLGDQYHTVSGNPIRFTPLPQRLEEDDAWKHEMTVKDRLAVATLTAPFLLLHHLASLEGRFAGARTPHPG